MGMLHVVPHSGLGNRLRVISSVYQYGKATGRNWVCHWYRERGLNASFASLFEPIPDLRIVDCGYLDYFIYNTPTKFNLYLPRIIDKLSHRKSAYELGCDQLPTHSHCDLITTASTQGELYPLQELFRPVKKIQQIIDDFSRNFTPHTIGCHIRRTDNEKSMAYSSTDKFEAKFDELFSSAPLATIYLCTDDPQLKSHLQAKYGSKILTYNATLSRQSATGIRDAVIEMWLLAKTREIWGSYWSSFTDMAACLGNCKLTIIK